MPISNLHNRSVPKPEPESYDDQIFRGVLSGTVRKI